jgi:hypothetical protein
MFFQLLQPNVMDNFNEIAIGHINPLFIIELVQMKGIENQENQ